MHVIQLNSENKCRSVTRGSSLVVSFEQTPLLGWSTKFFLFPGQCRRRAVESVVVITMSNYSFDSRS